MLTMIMNKTLVLILFYFSTKSISKISQDYPKAEEFYGKACDGGFSLGCKKMNKR